MCQRKCLAFGDIERIGRTLVNRFVNFRKYQQKKFKIKLLDLLDATIKDLFTEFQIRKTQACCFNLKSELGKM